MFCHYHHQNTLEEISHTLIWKFKQQMKNDGQFVFLRVSIKSTKSLTMVPQQAVC